MEHTCNIHVLLSVGCCPEAAHFFFFDDLFVYSTTSSEYVSMVIG
jgi:hypothetical protein